MNGGAGGHRDPLHVRAEASEGVPGTPHTPEDFDLSIANDLLVDTTIQFDLHYEPQHHSTMFVGDYCRIGGLALKEGVVLIAGEQTAGVGSNRGSTWYSAPGKDLMMTVVLDDTSADAHSQIMMTAASNMAAVTAMRELSGPYIHDYPGGEARIEVKWQNDMRVRIIPEDPDAPAGFCKSGAVYCAGENYRLRPDQPFLEPGFVLSGIGINLSADIERHPEVAQFRDVPLSYETLTGRLLRREPVVGTILRELDQSISLFRTDREAFYERLLGCLALGDDQAARVTLHSGDPKLPDGESFDARILRFSDEGLHLSRSGREEVFELPQIRRFIPPLS